jgi:hypothetical protein
MSQLSKAERARLPESAFGWPEKKLFVIQDQDDVAAAARLLPKVPLPERDTIQKRILAIGKRLGLTPPQAWTDAAMSEAAVEFAASPGTTEGGHVIRKADVIFKAGDYDFPAEKGGPFSMSPEEIMAYCAGFKDPVELEDTHVPSIFNGKLGHLVAVTPNEDYSAFGGDVRVSRWFDALFPNEPIKMSAKWDRGTKTLKAVAVLPNPRIDDAAMFAAFAAADDSEGDKGGLHRTPHGQKMVQYLHDLTAHGGARCSPDHSPGVKEASFHADHEASTIQKIHDMTLGSGAACALYRDNKTKNVAWQPGSYYKTAVEAMPAYRDYQPGAYALMSDADAPAREKKPEPTARERDLEAQLAVERRKNREGQLAALARESVTFAKQLQAESRIVPADFADVVAEYVQAGRDDLEHGGTADFADERGQSKKGTRLEALRARYQKRQPHVLTRELVPGDAAALFSRERTLTNDEKDLEDAKKQAEVYAASRNRNTNGKK